MNNFTDVDECLQNLHSCSLDSEACFNVAGSYECGCQWGYLFDKDIEECLPNEVLIAAETQAYKQHTSTKVEKPGKSSNSEVILA
jgi:hypothetical protein